MIGVPKESGSNLHMRIISVLSKNIMRNAWRESFMNAASADEALEITKSSVFPISKSENICSEDAPLLYYAASIFAA